MHAFKTFASLALPLLAVANPLVVRNDGNAACNTGSLNCCQTTQSVTATNPASGFLSVLLGLLSIPSGAPLDLGSGLVGTTCSPLANVNPGSNSCQEQTVCCTNNSFNGVIALGCTPINLNL